MSINRRKFVETVATSALLAALPGRLYADDSKNRSSYMKAKVGMNMLLWGANINSEHIPVFEGIADAGFDGVEVPVVGQSMSELSTMRKAITSLGLECTTATFISPEANPIDPDPAVRKNALLELKKRIDETAALGSGLLIGGIYQAHKYFVGRGATAEEWEWSKECLHAAGEYAQSLNIRLGIEYLNRFETFLINSAHDAQRMCKEIGLNNVGVLYDTHHANIEDPSPNKVLPEISEQLFHVHLSESHRGTLGTGQVNWDETFSALHSINYQGWLVIEAFGMKDPAIVNAANIWKESFDSPEQLYRDGVEFIRRNMAL